MKSTVMYHSGLESQLGRVMIVDCPYAMFEAMRDAVIHEVNYRSADFSPKRMIAVFIFETHEHDPHITRQPYEPTDVRHALVEIFDSLTDPKSVRFITKKGLVDNESPPENRKGQELG